MGLNHILDELLIGAARYGLVWLGGFFAIAVGLGALSLWVWRPRIGWGDDRRHYCRSSSLLSSQSPM